MVAAREAEADTGLLDALGDSARTEFDRDAQLLEHVGRPACDDAARLPCFTTRAPAPAATSAAIVETLIVPDRSPPVPHVSIAPSATSTWVAYRCIGADERGELVLRLTLRAQRDDECRRLHVGDPAFEDLADRGVDVVGGQLECHV